MMKKPKSVVMAFMAISFLFSVRLGLAEISPVEPWQSSELGDPSPPALTWNSSIAYYETQLIYVGSDLKIYGYDMSTGESIEVLDLSDDPNFMFGPSGFLVSHDNYLYFHDNGNTKKIYRIDLAATWPPDIESFNTGAAGSIFALTQNPWTDVVWFASGDFPPGSMYLCEVNSAFTASIQRASFPQPHSGGNGPIIFKGATTLLYGESVWGGNGYFHLVDSTTGNITQQDYLEFDGGLAGTAYGYNNVIYATTGGGKTIYEVRDATKTVVATTDDDCQSMVFDGLSFFVSTQVPFTGGQHDGSISLHEFRNPDASIAMIPTAPYRARNLGEPDPAIFPWNSTIAYYHNKLIYAGNDQKIHAYDIGTGNYTEVLDLSTDANFAYGPSGFLTGHDNYLYFHDNGNTKKIYRIDLAATWPPDIESFNTGAAGSIFALTQNPWTDAVWFNSADFGEGNMYLYEVNAAFDTATLSTSFVKPHGANAGNGPIIFDAENTLLYGESVWGGNGYFHLVDSSTGNIIDQDYRIFEGGLAGAVYGYDNVIYATSGAGKTVYEISDAAAKEAASATNDAQGIVFDGGSLYVSTLVPTSGTVSGQALWRLIPTGVPAGQEAPEGAVDGELAVNVEGEEGVEAVGISGGDSNTFVEYLASTDPDNIADQTNRPDRLPFGLISFRLKVTSPEGTATATVHLSKKAPEGSKWYRYDAVKGWLDYSDHAILSEDRESFKLQLKDGGYGDADRIVNGYITDPGGVGEQRSDGGGGGGGSCFISAAGSGLALESGISTIAAFVLAFLAGSLRTLSLFQRKG